MEEMKTNDQVHNSVVIDDGRIEALDEFLAPEQLYNDLISRVRKYHPSLHPFLRFRSEPVDLRRLQGQRPRSPRLRSGLRTALSDDSRV